MADVNKPLFKWAISETDVPKVGPYLSAARFAENVIIDDATHVMTIDHVVDRAGLSDAIKNVAKDTRINLPIKMLIAFKSGGFAGDAFVTVCQTNPSGEFDATSRAELRFDGLPSSIFQVISPVSLLWDKEGEYYFDVFLDGRFCSRMSLFLKIGRLEG